MDRNSSLPMPLPQMIANIGSLKGFALKFAQGFRSQKGSLSKGFALKERGTLIREINMQQSTRLSMRPLGAAILAAAWLLSVPTANAQAPSPGPSDQTPNVPDQKLDAAAAAMEQVFSVRENYQKWIEAAAPSDKQSIADEAKNALVKAITDQGLSIQEYASILGLAQNDPIVREKILQRIRPSAK